MHIYYDLNRSLQINNLFSAFIFIRKFIQR